LVQINNVRKKILATQKEDFCGELWNEGSRHDFNRLVKLRYEDTLELPLPPEKMKVKNFLSKLSIPAFLRAVSCLTFQDISNEGRLDVLSQRCEITGKSYGILTTDIGQACMAILHSGTGFLDDVKAYQKLHDEESGPQWTDYCQTQDQGMVSRKRSKRDDSLTSNNGISFDRILATQSLTTYI
jgi:hypothetical protein